MERSQVEGLAALGVPQGGGAVSPAVSTKLASICLWSHLAIETLAQPASPGAAFTRSRVQPTLSHPAFSLWWPWMEKRGSQQSSDFPETPGNEDIVYPPSPGALCPAAPHGTHTVVTLQPMSSPVWLHLWPLHTLSFPPG